MIETIAKYIHGSGDSTDTDTVYVVNDALPSFAECKAFCDSIKDENANLIRIEDGIVTACYKGTPDEINNALLDTYGLHEQTDALLVTRRVERNKFIKYVRGIRIMLSHLSRSPYRTQVKEALRGAWTQRLKTLKDVVGKDDINFDTLNKNMTGADIKKVLAFQTGQCLGLLDDKKELYTKQDIGDEYPALRPYLSREETENASLSIMITALVYRLFDNVVFEELPDNCVAFKKDDQTAVKIDLTNETCEEISAAGLFRDDNEDGDDDAGEFEKSTANNDKSRRFLPKTITVEDVKYHLDKQIYTDGDFAGWLSYAYVNDDMPFIYPSVSIDHKYIEYLVSMDFDRERALEDMQRKLEHGDLSKNFALIGLNCKNSDDGTPANE